MGVLRFLTAGESHGKALSVIVEGVPAGLPLSEDYIGDRAAMVAAVARRSSRTGRRSSPACVTA
jgi:chorismate synthase